MASVFDYLFYILVFFSVYAQVFFLFTFLENRKKIIVRKEKIKLARYPRVTIIVPAWNEEKTIYKTIKSLLSLNYPKDKLDIFLVDDGSTDGTFDIMKKFASNTNTKKTNYPAIRIFKKENGGKHTALNLGLNHTNTEYVGCFDADSMADSEALVRIMSYFEKDPETMAVVPSILARNSGNFIQKAQQEDYNMSVFLKKILSTIGAIHVTPGPLTIFRKKVFDDLGPYRHAHNTEDMEIAYRMQQNHYKIEHCNDAYVYTNTPSSVRTLYKQRLRWIYGFINNTIDYRNLLFKKKYGNFSFFTVPAGILSVLAGSVLFGRLVYAVGRFVAHKISVINITGIPSFSAKVPYIDLFFINARSSFIISITLFVMIIISVLLGRRMIKGTWNFSFNIFSFFVLFSIVGPFWLLKAVFNTIISKKPSWR